MENWIVHSRAWSSSCHAYCQPPTPLLSDCVWMSSPNTIAHERKDEDKAPKDASAGSSSSVAGWQARQCKCVCVGVCVAVCACVFACACVCVCAVQSVLMTCFVLARAPEKVKWTNTKRTIHLHNITLTHTHTHLPSHTLHANDTHFRLWVYNAAKRSQAGIFTWIPSFFSNSFSPHTA